MNTQKTFSFIDHLSQQVENSAPLQTLTVSIGILLTLAVILAVRDTFWRLRPRDQRRFFSKVDRRALIRQARGRCEHKPLLWIRCRGRAEEADHIIPWSRGGRTHLTNGQMLCRRHNRRKSNLMPGPLYKWRLRRRRKRWNSGRKSTR